MIFVQYVLPYLITLVVAVVSGFISYFSAIKKCKLDNEVKIKEIQEQHKLDLDNQKEMFKLEIEKINLQHQNEIEKIKLESQSQLTNNLTSTLLNSILAKPDTLNDIISLANKLKKN